jgi:hypothetical protein
MKFATKAQRHKEKQNIRMDAETFKTFIAFLEPSGLCGRFGLGG